MGRFKIYMCWSLCILLYGLIPFSQAEKVHITTTESIIRYSITENDTNTYQLNLAMDKNGKPGYFFRNIFTPVCITGECKPVFINFYWDLLGNYTHYDMPDGEILTKMDHDEFAEEDYAKLQDILINSGSLLKDIKMEDLISSGTENLSDSVDAKTGATLKSIKKEVIEGAVYTCFTLWHIAYGKVVTDKMKAVTDSLSDDSLLHTFLNSGNHHYQYWAMAKVMDENGKVPAVFLEDIKQVIRGKNIFAARYALQKLNPEQLDAGWLWTAGKQSSYAFQLEVLKKMSILNVSEPILHEMIDNLQNTNQAQSVLTINILEQQKQLPVRVAKKLAGLLSNPPSALNDNIYTLLNEKKIKNSEVKQYLLAYQKQKQPKP